MAQESESSQLERVKYLGTTWHKRGAAYWVRRVWVLVLTLVIVFVVALVSSAVLKGELRATSNSPGARVVVLGVYAILTLIGLCEGYARFRFARVHKRDHITDADRRYLRWHDWFVEKNQTVMGSAARIPVILFLFCFGGGYVLGTQVWWTLALLQKYASPEEYAAVRRSQGLPPVDSTALLAASGQEPQQPKAKKPEKLPLLGRSWTKRGAWYWTRRVAWTAFFVWIAFLAVRIAVDAVVLCAQGQWLQNKALAVGLALVPVAGSVFVGARGLLIFWRTVREDRDSRSGEWKYVGWVSLQQRAVGGVSGLLVFWYFYHSPSMALMHAAPGSARAFARFLLLFVVGVVLAWALACFGKYFGPEEYEAARAMKFSEQTQAYIDEVHESSRLTEAELRYQLNEAWRPPPET